MAAETLYATSLVDIQSEKEAEFYFDKVGASNPTGPVDLTIVDTEHAFGRQHVPAYEGMGEWHHPPHLLKPENDLSERTSINERLSTLAVPSTMPTGPSPAQVWALPGVAPSAWQMH